MTDQTEFLETFVEESQEHLQSIEPDLLALEESGENVDQDVINRIFRGVHSLKGASGFFGLTNIESLSHVMENLLMQVRDYGLKVTPELTDALLAGMDALKAMVEDVVNSETFDIQKELAELHRIWDEVSGSGKSKKDEPTKEAVESTSEYLYHFPKELILDLIDSARFYYLLNVRIQEDLKANNKTIKDYVDTLSSLGEYITSDPDVTEMEDLTQYPDIPIIHFLFATIMEPDLAVLGLEIDESQIILIDREELKKPDPPKETKQPEPKPKPEEKKEPPKEEKTPPKEPAKKQDSQPETKAPPADKKPSKVKVQAEEKIRVGVSFLNDLVNIAGELVLGRNQLLQIATPLVKETTGLNTVLQHISRVTSEMQEKIMQMRMQPVSMLFGKFQRIVRDLSKTLQKDIKLEIFGEEVELDKTIIEALSDPLTHLVRNSVDHGIEKPDEREQNGKPRAGKLILQAYHEGGQVHLEIRDDGKGINGIIIGRKAIEKGLITETEFENMSEKERIQLIFKAGFSTAEQVSSISGRGVGMDVVITNIKQLGGVVDIDSIVGKGTKIHIVLPLTLAIVSGLVIRVVGQTYIIPEANIDEMVRIKPEEISLRIDRIQKSRVLRLRDMLLPLIDLKQILNIKQEMIPPKPNDQPTKKSSVKISEPMRILIIKHGSSPFGLIVDSVESIEEIVVKPLPRYLKNLKSFSGASIMGNGSVALILDVTGIVEKANLHHLKQNIERLEAEHRESMSTDEAQTLLLFDNKSEEQFAMPLQLITRIERVPASRIERIRDKYFLQYQGQNLRLIFLEDYLPITKPERKKDDTIGVIIPKHVKYPMGIIMENVIGTETIVIDLDTSTVMAPGIFGTSILNGKITIFPDMYRLFQMAAPELMEDDHEKPVKKEADKTLNKILVVEDTPFFLMMIVDYLTSEGFIVSTATNGKKAFEKIERDMPHAVICDIVMPEMDGFEFIQTLRKNDRMKKIPVMAVTSLSDAAAEKKGLAAGFDAWELKLDKESLLTKLNMIITKYSE